MQLPVFRRRHAIVFLEIAQKAGEVGVADLLGNIIQLHGGFQQQPVGGLHAYFNQIVDKIAEGIFLEQLA